jgi:hypothetical protein
VTNSPEELLVTFKRDIKIQNTSYCVQRHITSGSCYALTEEQYFHLRACISDEFEIHHSEIVLVGSAKLGFSLSPKKRYRLFNDNSDIDVAIVSPLLFDKVWSSVYEFDRSKAYWPERKDFLPYFLKGWIRPDLLPQGATFEFSNEWWKFFNRLSSTRKYGSYPIRCGLYKSWFFLEKYHSICIEKCKESIGIST